MTALIGPATAGQHWLLPWWPQGATMRAFWLIAGASGRMFETAGWWIWYLGRSEADVCN